MTLNPLLPNELESHKSESLSHPSYSQKKVLTSLCPLPVEQINVTRKGWLFVHGPSWTKADIISEVVRIMSPLSV